MKKNRQFFGFIILMFVLCAGLLSAPVPAAAAGTYTLAVGDEMTLYSNIPASYAVTGVSWKNGNYQAIEIIEQNDSYCTIRVNEYFPYPIIIQCIYYYVVPYGYGGLGGQGSTDYTIQISDSGGGSDSGQTGNLTVSPSSVTLDLAKDESATVTLTYKDDGAKSHSFGFLSGTGCTRIEDWSLGGSLRQVTTKIHPLKPGTDLVTCNMFVTGKPTVSAKVKVTVTCSHKYDDGAVLVQPGPGKEGSMVYTCQIESCGNQFEAPIPALPVEQTEKETQKQTEKELPKQTEKETAGGSNKNSSTNNKTTAAPKLNKKSATLYVGKSLTLSVQGGKSGKKTWSSTNKKVATVNQKGKVTAKKPGVANIRVKTGGKTLTCRVTVKRAVSVSSTSITVAKGKKKAVTLTYKNGLKIKYGIANKKYVSCTLGKAKGNKRKLTIYGKKKGKTTITLTNSYNKEKIKLTVKIK